MGASGRGGGEGGACESDGTADGGLLKGAHFGQGQAAAEAQADIAQEARVFE